jgi:hypothetical protein
MCPAAGDSPSAHNLTVLPASLERASPSGTWAPGTALHARLVALWDEGLTAAEIGRRLGVTKNAVVGARRRHGLPSRPSPIGITDTPSAHAVKLRKWRAARRAAREAAA